MIRKEEENDKERNLCLKIVNQLIQPNKFWNDGYSVTPSIRL